ncbi:unnamed protein product [Cuscuta europaea]|uniref:Uncharacterized protein n=1 Tax=Cuscuta europaea TaxID=41803 RepID=A0A9P0YV73_CUSEU|nr:unnamed protein product [Cuscuta europaea]
MCEKSDMIRTGDHKRSNKTSEHGKIRLCLRPNHFTSPIKKLLSFPF